jgi:orotidine 5'-phosphate decarboxylase subfamily 2
LTFTDALQEQSGKKRSWLCVGLDPDLAMLPEGVPRTPEGVLRFCTEIIEATAHYVVAFKMQFAFFEALGPEAFRILKLVRKAVPVEIPVIADAKRGDIDSTSKAYASAILDFLGFDAVTVHAYPGWDSLVPFTSRLGKGVIVVCKTSNAGSSDLQDLEVDGEKLYMRVAREALALDVAADVGLVVGATQLDALRDVRALSEEVIILGPGIGSQGAQITEALAAGANTRGDNLLLAASRSIAFASRSRDYVESARAAAEKAATESWGKREQQTASRL